MQPVERADVERWSPEERARVARILDGYIPRPSPQRPPRQRLVAIAVTCAGAVALIPWITYLSLSLPRSYSVRAWNVAWVGFDIALALCLGVTGWWILRRRQLAMFGLVAAATLLACDAWFDVVLAWNTSGEKWAMLNALVEIPLALFLAASALRILDRTVRIVRQLRGVTHADTSVWRERFVMLPADE